MVNKDTHGKLKRWFWNWDSHKGKFFSLLCDLWEGTNWEGQNAWLRCGARGERMEQTGFHSRVTPIYIHKERASHYRLALQISWPGRLDSNQRSLLQSLLSLEIPNLLSSHRLYSYVWWTGLRHQPRQDQTVFLSGSRILPVPPQRTGARCRVVL